MQDLQGKTVLLIVNPGYSSAISEAIRSLGADVIYINDKPGNGFFHKALGRWKVKPYMKYVLEKYYYDKISKIQHIDYILAIRGEYTPESALMQLKIEYPNAKRILYMWDSIQNNKGIEKKWDLYDEVWTFDRKDYLDRQGRIRFHPLFYCDSMMPDETKEEPEYEISFVGTGHGDRIPIIKKYREICREKGWRMLDYCYLPHQMVYLYNKIFNRYFRHVRISDVRFRQMDRKKVYDIYNHSCCILDVESKTQTGLTMRTIEILGLKRKLLTTNKDIVNYDFYHPDNIYIFDRNYPDIDNRFMEACYHQLPDEIYKKYSLSSWIKTILLEDNDEQKEPIFTK